MALTIEELFEQAMTLPPEARAQLADLLVASLDDDVLGPHDGLWLAEAQRRLDDIRSGRVRTIPGDNALQRGRGLKSTPTMVGRSATGTGVA